MAEEVDIMIWQSEEPVAKIVDYPRGRCVRFNVQGWDGASPITDRCVLSWFHLVEGVFTPHQFESGQTSER